MPISDDVILSLAKELGANTQANRELTAAISNHILDPQAHSGVIPRVASLEKINRLKRYATGLTVMGAGGTAVAGTKLGWVSSIIAAAKSALLSGGGS